MVLAFGTAMPRRQPPALSTYGQMLRSLPSLLRDTPILRRRAGAVSGRLNEMINDADRILRGQIPVQVSDFFPPLRRVFTGHHCLPTTHQQHLSYKRNRGEIMYTVCPREAGLRAFDLSSKEENLGPLIS